MMGKRGWFADLSDEDERDPHAPWQAFLQLEGHCHALDGVWFYTEADCVEFIRTEIVGRGWFE